MPVAPVSAPTSGPPTSPVPTPVASSSSLDREAFLKLLVAQLKYQDPSKPVDASEMISQSAQLSVVDKLDQINTALSESGATNRLTLGGSIIGKQIIFAGADGYPVTEVVNAVSFDGPLMVLRAGSWDVPVDAVRSILAVPAPLPQPAPTGAAAPAPTPVATAPAPEPAPA